MLRGAQAIRLMIGWDDPIERASIKAYLEIKEDTEEVQDVEVEAKKRREVEERRREESNNKRQSQRLVERNPRKEMP